MKYQHACTLLYSHIYTIQFTIGKDTLLLPVYHDWKEKKTHIEADQQALDELKNSWNRQPHNESRGNKRKYDIISDESLTPINRELNWLNTQRSRLVSVQSNRQSSSSTQSNPLSVIVLVNNPEVLPPPVVSGKGVASGDPMEVESVEPTPKVDEPAILETEVRNELIMTHLFLCYSFLIRLPSFPYLKATNDDMVVDESPGRLANSMEDKESKASFGPDTEMAETEKVRCSYHMSLVSPHLVSLYTSPFFTHLLLG